MSKSRVLRCAILNDYQGVALRSADWTALEGAVETTVFREHIADEDQLAAAISAFDIVVIMRERTAFRRALIQRLPQLRLLVTTGSRNGSVDVDACTDHGIAVCGTGNAELAAAELTWALILAFQRNIVQEANALKCGGPWQSTLGREVATKRLGIIGLGRLGTKVAKVGLALGMNVQAWSHNLTPQRCADAGVEWAPDLPALLASSDIVSIHLVLSDRTRGLLGDKELRLMKRTALLVNTSRAPIVDEVALVRSLEDGLIAGAALDVFESEPLPESHPFRQLPNVLATPHIGYVTEETYGIFFRDVVEDIAAFLSGKPVRCITQQHPAQAAAPLG